MGDIIRKEPHVLIFPLPLQGPVNSMLKLAELLCLAGIRLTFLNTQHIHRRLLRNSDVESRFRRYPKFRFQTITDGLPEDNPRSGEGILELLDSMEAVSKPIFAEMLTSGEWSSKSDSPVTCVIPDGIFMFALDVANAIGIPVLYFDTISPCGLLTYLCVPKLIEAGELPLKGNNLDQQIISVPSMENFLRQRDLPCFLRADDINEPIIQLVIREALQIPKCQGLIFNTFEELEKPVLTEMRKLGPDVYAVGPLHGLLKSQITSPASSNSLFEENESCIAWLDSQPSKSVIYTSIGSFAVMTWQEMIEFWYGLANSGKRFLWVRRPGSVYGEEKDESRIPVYLKESTEKRGFIVGWAPQEKVLSHPSICAFLTHSGWNSTLECIMEGKPMICWPHFVDQHVNSRFVSEIWKIGLDMKDSCDRDMIEKLIRDVFEVRGDEFTQSTKKLADSAKESVREGGSSYCELSRLIRDIKEFRFEVGNQ